ncbi:dynamin family protein [Candidatus Spyradosoma sp. SGI.093]|uniref:dynamin family protein n=1 Tax=Candidatus Spyradosoma sp. SGI.093 TaxID=3420583 RepID=UPI003D009D8E
MTELVSRESIEDLLTLFCISRNFPQNKCDEKRKAFFGGFLRELSRMRERSLRTTSDYKIAVVGLGNVGKSSLLNAVLGERVAPTGNRPCTSDIVEFRHSATRYILAESPNSAALPGKWEFDDAAQLHEQLCSMVAHDDGGDAHEWKRIEVGVPAEVLKGGLTLVDTPGFGAAGTAGAQDNATVRDFLNNDVAQIFWVVLSEQGIQRAELDFYREYLAARCDDVIVTNGEDWDENDRRRWRARYAPALAPECPQIRFVKNKQAQTARAERDAAAWRDSGVADVCGRILQLKDTDGRIESLNSRLGFLGGLALCALQNLRAEGRAKNLLDPVWSAKISRKYAGTPLMENWLKMLSENR